MSAIRKSGKNSAGVIGVGVAACAVCCAGPVLGFLAALGVGTILGVSLFGGAGLLIVLLAVPRRVRRRNSPACESSEPVSVELGPTK